MYSIGDEADNILTYLSLNEEDSATFNGVKAKFDANFIGSRNVIYERGKVRLLDDLSQITFVLDDMSQKGAICSKIIWTICHNFVFSTWTICHTFILDDLSQVIFVLDGLCLKKNEVVTLPIGRN